MGKMDDIKSWMQNPGEKVKRIYVEQSPFVKKIEVEYYETPKPKKAVGFKTDDKGEDK